jgi:hypothetical protein
MLLEEEMRRVIAFGYWKADWWRKQADRRSNAEEALFEGLQAYAAEHVHLELAFVEKVQEQWRDVRERAKLIIAELAGGTLSDHPSTVINVEIELDEDEL